jgi:two-component system sensor histidine kinase KdpD
VLEEEGEGARDSGRGRLSVFLGTAVGVGKTYAMLNEGSRRSRAGQDVVIGYWERHGRGETEDQQYDLQVIPPRLVTYRGTTLEELDVDAVVARGPDVALVDELAHTNVAEQRSRWRDVDELLDEGIDVMSTLNVANLESVREYAAEVTGAGSVEMVPDDLLRHAQVRLVDLPPDVLRQRVAAGHVYSADRVGGALANYFQARNLAALSELAKAWMAGSLDEEGPVIVGRYADPRPRRAVIAAISGSEGCEAVIRRAAEMADADDAALLVVHVGEGVGQPTTSAEYRSLTQSLGATYMEIRSEDPVDGLVIAAVEHDAQAIVVGRHRSRWVELLRGSVARRLRRQLPNITVEPVEHS